MKRTIIIGLMMAIHGLGLPAMVHADDSRPLYVEITEVETNTYTLQMKIPPTIPVSNQPTVAFPSDCVEVRDPRLLGTARDRTKGRAGGQRCYACEDGLSGREISIHYPGYTPSVSSLIKFTVQTGETHTVALGPHETAWRIPEAETRSSVAKDYTRLGIFHIWAGKDHLLFLVCLLWIAGSLRRVLTTITGFTAAHSVSLALSALNVIRIPIPPVEAVIALSVVFLAREMAKGQSNNLTWRHPIAVSSSFGLLHGLGFAAALGEIGLPQTELLTGLLFFNVGVEIGQVIFATVTVLLIFMIKHSAERWMIRYDATAFLRTVMSYGVGVTASFWLVERTVAFLGSSAM